MRDKTLGGIDLDKKKETYTFLKDTTYENNYLPNYIDRIINEGMAGGNVYSVGQMIKILKKHTDFFYGAPPNVNQ